VAAVAWFTRRGVPVRRVQVASCSELSLSELRQVLHLAIPN